MAAVVDHGSPRVEDPGRLAGVAALGVDETAWLAANRGRHTRYVSGLVDLDSGRLLDVVEDRTAKAVADWLAEQPTSWLGGVGVVALDPHRGYANAMATALGHATVVVDHWHVIRLANGELDSVRRRVQQATLGHRGRRRDPLYGIRRLLAVGAERLDPAGIWRLIQGLAAGDRDGAVAAAWQAKEILHDVYLTREVAHGAAALEVFYDWCAEHPLPELKRLAATVRLWEAEILAWHATGGRSNARSEACNLAIKRIKRVGRGFRNFEPAAAVAALRRRLAYCPYCKAPTPSPPRSCVEPE